MATLRNALSQSAFIPSPPLTEKNLPSQAGRVFIVTGGYAGVGEALCTILYGANGTVYVAGRSAEKASKALERIKAAHPNSQGTVTFLKLDLADLATIKPAVDEFLGKEKRLDVLTNNAGVMFPPAGSKTAQGYELQIGTNCVGHFLLASLLRPILASTAKSAPPGSVRVTWAGSMAVDLFSPRNGLTFVKEQAGQPRSLGKQGDYGQSKAGNFLLSGESKKRWGDSDGVVHVSWNPGNLKSELQRHTPGGAILGFFLYNAKNGAYTELFAGWSDTIGMEQSGSYVVPWGRIGTVRPDLYNALKTTEEGGAGTSAAFWDWCEKETAPYMEAKL